MSSATNIVVDCVNFWCRDNKYGKCYGPQSPCDIYKRKVSDQMEKLSKEVEEISMTETNWEDEAKRMTDLNQSLIEENKELRDELECMSGYIKSLEDEIAFKKAELRGFYIACTGKETI